MVVSVMDPKLLMKMLQVTLTGGPGRSSKYELMMMMILLVMLMRAHEVLKAECSRKKKHLPVFIMKFTSHCVKRAEPAGNCAVTPISVVHLSTSDILNILAAIIY